MFAFAGTTTIGDWPAVVLLTTLKLTICWLPVVRSVARSCAGCVVELASAWTGLASRTIVWLATTCDTGSTFGVSENVVNGAVPLVMVRVAGVPGKMLIWAGCTTRVGGAVGPGAYGLLGDPPPPQAARLST